VSHFLQAIKTIAFVRGSGSPENANEKEVVHFKASQYAYTTKRKRKTALRPYDLLVLRPRSDWKGEQLKCGLQREEIALG